MEARKMSVTLWRLLSKSSLGECFATRTYTNYSKSDDQSPTEKLKQVQVVFSKSQNPDPDNMHLLRGTYRKWWDIGSGFKHDSLTTRTQQKTPSNVDCSRWANYLIHSGGISQYQRQWSSNRSNQCLLEDRSVILTAVYHYLLHLRAN